MNLQSQCGSRPFGVGAVGGKGASEQRCSTDTGQKEGECNSNTSQFLQNVTIKNDVVMNIQLHTLRIISVTKCNPSM